jgi:hypothetical protein
MSASNKSSYLHINGAIGESAAICVLLVAIGVLSGCGGYRAPTGGTMPGQAPRTYPMQHPTAGRTIHRLTMRSLSFGPSGKFANW